MQDRYLFRGKRTDLGKWALGKWVTGHFVSVPRHMIVLAEPLRTSNWFTYDVDPATIGQCTGLKDKNGKLIFEGDIIKSITDEDEPEIYSVSFKTFRWMLINELYDYQELNDFVNDYTTFEVVGNIHDNPELLNGEV